MPAVGHPILILIQNAENAVANIQWFRENDFR